MLWFSTWYGMSLEQLKQVLPEVTRPSTPQTLKGGRVELARLEDIEMVEQRFHASFYFQGNKLKQVTLTLETRSPFSKTLLIFNRLADIFRGRYGTEISRTSTRHATGLNREAAMWISGRTKISALTMGVGDQDASLKIDYQRPVPVQRVRRRTITVTTRKHTPISPRPPPTTTCTTLARSPITPFSTLARCPRGKQRRNVNRGLSALRSMFRPDDAKRSSYAAKRGSENQRAVNPLGSAAEMTSPAFPARKRGRQSQFSIAETSSLD